MSSVGGVAPPPPLQRAGAGSSPAHSRLLNGQRPSGHTRETAPWLPCRPPPPPSLASPASPHPHRRAGLRSFPFFLHPSHSIPLHPPTPPNSPRWPLPRGATALTSVGDLLARCGEGVFFLVGALGRLRDPQREAPRPAAGACGSGTEAARATRLGLVEDARTLTRGREARQRCLLGF